MLDFFPKDYELSDLNKNGIQEVHFELYTSRLTGFTPRKIQIVEERGSEIKTIWANDEFYVRILFDSLNSKYYLFDVNLGEEGRYDPHKFMISQYSFIDNTFQKVNTSITRHKYLHNHNPLSELLFEVR